MDKTWIGKSKTSLEYKEGVENFIKFAVENGSIEGKILCPCRNCSNNQLYDPKVVREHLRCDRFLLGYTNWLFLGESISSQDDDDGVNDDNIGESLVDLSPSSGKIGMSSDMSGLIRDACTRGCEDPADSALHNESSMNFPNNEQMRYLDLLEDNEEELYLGCKKFSKLSFLMHLLLLKCMNGWSAKSVSLLLNLLKDAFPNASLPSTYYEAKKLISKLGFGYDKIHSCPNDCILYWNGRDKQESCHVCGLPRWVSSNDDTGDEDVVVQKKRPAKVLRYFPLIPRLKRMYTSSKTASSMRWHHEGRTKDGLLRHPADALAWKSFDARYPDFASDPHNIRLGLASDGFNPYRTMSSTYSTWPVVMTIYNMSPWLFMKESSMILLLVIPGKKGLGNDIDTYLQPLVKELQQLWEGVDAYDASTKQNFKLRAALIWTNNDFPAYANLSGWSTKGRVACPCCGEFTHSRWLKHGGKFCYIGHRRWLEQNHPFRAQCYQFDGNKEHRVAPIAPSGLYVFKQVNRLHHIYGKASGSSKKRARENAGVATNQLPVEEIGSMNQMGLFETVDNFLDETNEGNGTPTSSMSGVPHQLWKKRSILFYLPYWKFNLLRHNLDVMHIEKNVCDNLIGTMLNIEGRTKDNLKARLDLKDMGIKHHLHPIQLNDNKFLLPPAPYTMSLQEKDNFLTILKNLKVPDGYVANISRCVNLKERKLSNLKTHDAHILMQDLLPIAIRASMPKPIVAVVSELSAFFKALRSKTRNPLELDHLQSRIVSVLCHMEKLFSPSFFTIMVHLTVHLVAEAKLGGTVHGRWMYSIERYLMRLKSYVCNRAQPEGSIAEGYLARECLTFCSRYIEGVETLINRPLRNEVASTKQNFMFSSGGMILKTMTPIKLDELSLAQAHRYVLLHSDNIEEYRREFLDVQQAKQNIPASRNLKHKWLVELFFEWLLHKVPKMIDGNCSPELIALASGPNDVVQRFHGFSINGFRFRIKDSEKFIKTQNSGVMVEADGKSYYGKITSIYELDYNGSFKVVLFRCDWVNINSLQGFRKALDGSIFVNFSKMIHTGKNLKDDPFIFSSHAKQVFYVTDPTNKEWSQVIMTKSRDLYDMGQMLEEEEDGSYTQCVPSNVVLDDELNDCFNYSRTDVEGQVV